MSHELAIRESFKGMLEDLAKANKWTLVVEQYQVKTDKNSGITSYPNQFSEDVRLVWKSSRL